MIGADKAKRRSGLGEVRFAAAENKRAKVEVVLVDETGSRKTRRQVGPGNVDDARDLVLQPANERFEIVADEGRIGADRR